MSFLETIISGGQTGADLGALVCAKRLGITTGGWAPKGFKTEKGPQPVLAEYGLLEHESADYPPRTEQNVIDADATLILSTNAKSPGTIQTVNFAAKHGKDHSGVIDPFSDDAVTQVSAFLLKYKPTILNVGGNRESKSPGITKRVADVLTQAIQSVAGSQEEQQPAPTAQSGTSSGAAIKYRCNQDSKLWEVIDTTKADYVVLFTSLKTGFKGRLEAIEEIARLATEGGENS